MKKPGFWRRIWCHKFQRHEPIFMTIKRISDFRHSHCRHCGYEVIKTDDPHIVFGDKWYMFPAMQQKVKYDQR